MNVMFENNLFKLSVVVSRNPCTDYFVSVVRIVKHLSRLSVEEKDTMGMWKSSLLKFKDFDPCYSRIEELFVIRHV